MWYTGRRAAVISGMAWQMRKHHLPPARGQNPTAPPAPAIQQSKSGDGAAGAQGGWALLALLPQRAGDAGLPLWLSQKGTPTAAGEV
ncbi:hypothetical protein HMPREF0262_02357 [Clostridium sp. ATCC 29733]|nr:hypothetical protein HMPREF0262_02357 [Clostridium sp. ATCC 29733]